MKNEGFWDRKLMTSNRELNSLRKAINEHEGNPKAMRKKIKQISKFYKSRLGEVARLDDTLYNVREHTQEAADGDTGPETQGDEPTDRESD